MHVTGGGSRLSFPLFLLLEHVFLAACSRQLWECTACKTLIDALVGDPM